MEQIYTGLISVPPHLLASAPQKKLAGPPVMGGRAKASDRRPLLSHATASLMSF